MSLYTEKTVILAKLEPTAGTDAIPTGAANAVLASNLSLTPLGADLQDRENFRGFYGAYPQLVTNKRVELAFDVEIAGAGANDTAPAWADLLKACAFNEVINTGSNVTFTPITDSIPSITIYVYLDGVLQKLVGARGTVSMNFSAGGIPKFSFTFTGVYAAPTDNALSGGATFTDWKAPLAVDGQATLSLHGTAVVANEFNLDVGNNVVSEDIIGAARIDVRGRQATGSVTIDYTRVSTKDWVGLCAAQSTGALLLTLGASTAGRGIQLNANRVALSNPVIGDREGLRTLQLALRFVPFNGNDDFSLISK